MAKLAVINREAKRRATVKKFADKRKQLLSIIQDSKATDDAKRQEPGFTKPATWLATGQTGSSNSLAVWTTR